MKLIIDIGEKRFKDIQRIASIQIRRKSLTCEQIIANGTPLEDIVDGIKSHKWGHNEGSKEIYNNAIDDVLTYIEEKLGE